MNAMKRLNQYSIVAFLCIVVLTLVMVQCKMEEIPVVEVTTYEATNITGNSVTIEGEIISTGGATITKKGICISKSINPTPIDGHVVSTSTANKFSVEVIDLNPNEKFYFRAFAVSSAGVFYGEESNFFTLKSVPQVETKELSNVEENSATCGGVVLNDGGEPVESRGVCWGTNENPTISDSTTLDGTGLGSFTSNVSGLSPTTQYYIRAYATNSIGTGYGKQKKISTGVLYATVITAEPRNITSTSVTSGGEVTCDGGDEVTSKGVCWSINDPPTIEDSYSIDGSGEGIFESKIDTLNMGTEYYIRAYAINGKGVAYGEVFSFTTDTELPTVKTYVPESFSTTSATLGGEITCDGGSSLSNLGICLSSEPDVTIDNGSIYDQSNLSIGEFDIFINNLSPGTKYFYRAFATNNKGTGYGSEKTFTTKGLPIVETFIDYPSITKSSVNCGGDVSYYSSSFYAHTTGVIWGTDSSPTLENCLGFTEGTETWTIEEKISDLTPSTTYYIRAYAMNDYGVGYGDILEFKTLTLSAWNRLSDFPGEERSGAFSFSIGGFGYLGGGSRWGSIQNDFWKYDPVNDTWTQVASSPATNRVSARSFTIEDKGYVGFGGSSTGEDLKDIWEYDPISNSWLRMADFPGVYREGIMGFSLGCKGYFGTGVIFNSPPVPPENLNDFWEFDPENNTWTQKNDFPGQVRGYAKGFSINTNGYLFGGIYYIEDNYTDPLDDFWKYEPNTDSWIRLSDSGTLNNVVVNDDNTAYNIRGIRIWEYDEENDEWFEKASVPIEYDYTLSGVSFTIGSKVYYGVGKIWISGNSYLSREFWEFNPSYYK
jgi:N-acetylneuraminic acid mutarotase